jgi:hypothetical protein
MVSQLLQNKIDLSNLVITKGLSKSLGEEDDDDDEEDHKKSKDSKPK